MSQTCKEINDEKNNLRESIQGYDDQIAFWRDQPGGEHEENNIRERRTEAQRSLNEVESLGGVIPDDCFGTYPNDRYQITWDEKEDGLIDGTRLMGWLSQMLFALSKTAVAIMLWLVRLAFTFDVTEYRHSVADFAGRLDRGLVHFTDGDGETEGYDLTLFEVAWFALFAYAAFQVLRGRTGRAAAEIVMSIFLAAVGWALLSNSMGNLFSDGPTLPNPGTEHSVAPAYQRDGYFDSFGEMVNMSSLALLLIANGDSPNEITRENMDRHFVETQLRNPDVEDPDDAGVLGRLHKEFIERPYLFINYGKETFEEDEPSGLNLPGEITAPTYRALSCDEVQTNLVSVPEKTGTWINSFMRRHGCDEEADWNSTMTPGRLMNAVLVTAVALIVSVMLGMAAVTLLVAKFLVAVFFAALPLAIVGAILPGRARRLAWGWATTLLQLWLAALGMGLVLAVLVMSLDAIHATTGDRSLAERWVMVLLVASTIYMLRKRIVSATHSVATGVSERLTGGTTGAGPSWAGAGGPTGPGGAPGVTAAADLAAADRADARAGFMTKAGAVFVGSLGARAVAGAARPAMWAAGSPYRLGRQRLQENRMARKGQRWHWANLRANAARNAHATAHAERAKDAEEASHAFGSVREILGGHGGKTGHFTGGSREAARKLGVSERDMDAWNHGLRAGRPDHATRRRIWDQAENAAGLAQARAAGESLPTLPGFSDFERREHARQDRIRRVMNERPGMGQWPSMLGSAGDGRFDEDGVVGPHVPGPAGGDGQQRGPQVSGPADGGQQGASILRPQERRTREDSPSRQSMIVPPWGRPSGAPPAAPPPPTPPADPEEVGRRLAARASGAQDMVDRSARGSSDYAARQADREADVASRWADRASSTQDEVDRSARGSSDYAARQADREADIASRWAARASGAQDKVDRDARRLWRRRDD